MQIAYLFRNVSTSPQTRLFCLLVRLDTGFNLPLFKTIMEIKFCHTLIWNALFFCDCRAWLTFHTSYYGTHGGVRLYWCAAESLLCFSFHPDRGSIPPLCFLTFFVLFIWFNFALMKKILFWVQAYGGHVVDGKSENLYEFGTCLHAKP